MITLPLRMKVKGKQKITTVHQEDLIKYPRIAVNPVDFSHSLMKLIAKSINDRTIHVYN